MDLERELQQLLEGKGEVELAIEQAVNDFEVGAEPPAQPQPLWDEMEWSPSPWHRRAEAHALPVPASAPQFSDDDHWRAA